MNRPLKSQNILEICPFYLLILTSDVTDDSESINLFDKQLTSDRSTYNACAGIDDNRCICHKWKDK